MKILRAVGCVGLLLVTLTAWTGRHVRKELVRLQLSTRSGAPAQVRVVTRGLFAMAPPLSHARQATVSTPVELSFGGIGEADIRVVDSTAALVVLVTQVRQHAPPAQRLVGPAFRVSRTASTEPFLVTPLEKATASERQAASAVGGASGRRE
mgnify:CR=1 FL=1